MSATTLAYADSLRRSVKPGTPGRGVHTITPRARARAASARGASRGGASRKGGGAKEQQRQAVSPAAPPGGPEANFALPTPSQAAEPDAVSDAPTPPETVVDDEPVVEKPTVQEAEMPQEQQEPPPQPQPQQEHEQEQDLTPPASAVDAVETAAAMEEDVVEGTEVPDEVEG